MQRRELAKGVTLAGAQPASFASILQILGRLARRHIRKKDRPAPEFRRPLDHAVTGDLNLVMQNNVVADDGIWPDGDFTSKFSLRTNDRGWVKGHFATLS